MPDFKNFDHHMAQLTLLHDIELADGWAEHFDHTVSEEELQDGQICDAAITFAINLWRSGEEDYANATPPEYKAQLKGCWARRDCGFDSGSGALVTSSSCSKQGRRL